MRVDGEGHSKGRGQYFCGRGRWWQGEKPEMKPTKWAESRRQNRVTEAQRKSDNAMLTRNRDRGEQEAGVCVCVCAKVK